MTKTKTQKAKARAKIQQKQNGGSRRNRTRVLPTFRDHARYLSLLNDPCHADTDLSALYPGERGIIQRFLRDGTINYTAGGTSTAGFLFYHPASGTLCVSYQADSTSTQAISLSSYVTSSAGVAAPGYGYLTSNADKCRAVAACIQVNASGLSITNLVGECSVGVVSMDTTFGTWSVNDVFTMLGAKANITREAMEVKWYPGTLDDRYNMIGNLTTVDTSDSNVVAFAWRGYPSNVYLSVRLTAVLEWTPKLGVGIPASNQVREVVPHNQLIAQLQNAKPNWFHNLGSTVTAYAGQYAGQLLGTFGKSAVRSLSAGLAML